VNLAALSRVADVKSTHFRIESVGVVGIVQKKIVWCSSVTLRPQANRANLANQANQTLCSTLKWSSRTGVGIRRIILQILAIRSTLWWPCRLCVRAVPL